MRFSNEIVSQFVYYAHTTVIITLSFIETDLLLPRQSESFQKPWPSHGIFIK